MTELLISNGKRHLLPIAGTSWATRSYTITPFLFSNTISLKTEVKRATWKHVLRLTSGFSPAAGITAFWWTKYRAKVLPALDWMFESNLLTKQNLPQFFTTCKRFALCRFYGPADDFSNLSFEEFDDAEYWFHELMNPICNEYAVRYTLPPICPKERRYAHRLLAPRQWSPRQEVVFVCQYADATLRAAVVYGLPEPTSLTIFANSLPGMAMAKVT